MKKFLVVFSILLYAFSCAGMDQQDPTEAFIAAAAHGDDHFLQSIIESYDVPQEILNQACSAAMENGHRDVAHFLCRYEHTLDLDHEKMSQEKRQSNVEEQLRNAIDDEDLDFMKQLLEEYHFDRSTLEQARFNALARKKLHSMAFLNYCLNEDSMRDAPELIKQNQGNDNLFSCVIKAPQLSSEYKLLVIQDLLSWCFFIQQNIDTAHQTALEAGELEIAQFLDKYKFEFSDY